MKKYIFNADGTVTYRIEALNEEYTLGETELETLRLLSRSGNLGSLLGHSIYPSVYKVGCVNFTRDELTRFISEYDEFQTLCTSCVTVRDLVIARQARDKLVKYRAILLANGKIGLVDTVTCHMVGVAVTREKGGVPFAEFCTHTDLVEVVKHDRVSD